VEIPIDLIDRDTIKE